jgi:hypothetical protein
MKKDGADYMDSVNEQEEKKIRVIREILINL